MLNNVELIGRVGNEPELRYTPSNKAVVRLSIATTETAKDKTVKTTWHNVTVWEKTAENVEKYVKKGDLIYIQGRIEYTEKDGKYYTAIIANTVKFLSVKGGDKQAEKPIPQPPQKQNRQPENVKADDLGDDDIPF